jgi:hypothetical protein
MLRNAGLGAATGFFSLNESLGGQTMRIQANMSMKRYKS